MIIARGGKYTGRDGKALRQEETQKVVWAYVSMEIENSLSTVYFNREREKNGIFSKLDTGERQSIPQIIDQLVRCGEFENSLKRFFVEIGEMLDAGAFMDDYSIIALEAPESLTIEKLSRFEEAAKAKTNMGRQHNMKEGLDYRYDLFGSARKEERLNSPEYTSAPRLANLFAKLRAA